MFSLSKGIHYLPTMDWRQIRERMFNRWAGALNSIGRDSLKEETVTRLMISEDVLVKASGFRAAGTIANVIGGPGMDVKLLSIGVETFDTSNILVAYNIGLRLPTFPAPWLGRAFRTTVSVDGIRFGFGVADCQANMPFAGSIGPVAARIVCSGMVVAPALRGPHVVSIGLRVPESTTPEFTHGGEVSIAALEW